MTIDIAQRCNKCGKGRVLTCRIHDTVYQAAQMGGWREIPEKSGKHFCPDCIKVFVESANA